MVNNSSISFSNTMSTSTVHIILNFISLIATSLGTLICFIVLVGSLLRRKTFYDVQLLLCTNNYILVFALGILELIHNINTLQGDFNLMIVDEKSIECRIQAYILFSFISTVYMACVLQAIFRLCRIVYPTFIWLLNARTYLIIIPIMWIGSFVLISPIYIWYGQRLIPGENICRVPKNNPFSIAYTTIIIYGIPFIALSLTYFQVHRFLRQQARATILDFSSTSRHRLRDVMVFRRIVIIVTLLGSYGMPNSVMLIMLAITGELVSSFYRILDLSLAACVLTLSVAFFYLTPQLRTEIKICPRRIRVTTITTRDIHLKQRTLDQNQLKTASVQV